MSHARQTSRLRVDHLHPEMCQRGAQHTVATLQAQSVSPGIHIASMAMARSIPDSALHCVPLHSGCQCVARRRFCRNELGSSGQQWPQCDQGCACRSAAHHEPAHHFPIIHRDAVMIQPCSGLDNWIEMQHSFIFKSKAGVRRGAALVETHCCNDVYTTGTQPNCHNAAVCIADWCCLSRAAMCHLSDGDRCTWRW